MSDIVPMEVRRERNEKLRILSHKKKLAFTTPFLGTVRPVLVEYSHDTEIMTGFTDNYIKVTLPKDETLVNTVVNVKLLRWDDSFESVVAEVV